MTRTLRNMLVALVCVLTLPACDKASPTSPTPNSNPEPAPPLDKAPRRLVDGGGKEGPLTVSMISLGEGFGGYSFLAFEVKICMDAIPNPRNNPFLSQARVWLMWSEDGTNPLPAQPGRTEFVTVVNDSCTTWKVENTRPDFGSKYILFVGNWGPYNWGANVWNDKPCPTHEGLERWNSPEVPCVLRTVPAYDLSAR